MAKNCGHTVPCGCKDTALTTPPPCNSSGDCAGEPCSELFAHQCLVYNGASFYININEDSFYVNTGDRLDTIIQKLMYAQQSGADDFDETAFGVRFTSIQSTSFTVTWEGLDTVNYEVEYRIPAGSWTTVAITSGVYTHTVTGLVSGTTYEVRVKAVGYNPSPNIFVITLP